MKIEINIIYSFVNELPQCIKTTAQTFHNITFNTNKVKLKLGTKYNLLRLDPSNPS